MTIHHRRSIRLKGYDYSKAGAYFVTICTAQRDGSLGSLCEGRVHLTRFGRIVQAAWEDLPDHYPYVILDAFCIMPDHVHGIIVISSDGSDDSTRRHGLPEIVRAFKSFSARRINRLAGTSGRPFWQRNYYERIIRDERGLDAVRRYIMNNPSM